jgi:hypothetical protein
MNVQLRQVLSDITGVSGLRIIEAILAGERDGKELAALADKRVGATQATIKKAMQGDYRAEHLFVLQSAFELRQNYQKRIHLCDEQIIAQMAQWPDRVDLEQKPAPPRKAGRAWLREMVAGKDPRQELYRRTGVDLTAIEGIGVLTAQVILSEIGLDMSAWRSEKHFASWLGLCPDNRVSGGKVLSSHTRHVLNPVAARPPWGPFTVECEPGWGRPPPSPPPPTNWLGLFIACSSTASFTSGKVWKITRTNTASASSTTSKSLPPLSASN